MKRVNKFDTYNERYEGGPNNIYFPIKWRKNHSATLPFELQSTERFSRIPAHKSKIECRPERCQQWALNAGYRVKNGDRGRRPLGSCWSQIDGIVDYNGRTVFGRFMAFGKVVNNGDDRPFRIGWPPIIIRYPLAIFNQIYSTVFIISQHTECRRQSSLIGFIVSDTSVYNSMHVQMESWKNTKVNCN